MLIVIREILTLTICDASQPFSKGGFWRETLAEVLSLWSTIKPYPCHALPQWICFRCSPESLEPNLLGGKWLPPEHGFSPLQDWRRPVGLLLLALLKYSRIVLRPILCLMCCLSQGPCLQAREAKGYVGTSWERGLSGQESVAVSLTLKKLRCEIIVDQDLLKAWNTELMFLWIVFFSLSFHLIFLHYVICIWIYGLWKVPDSGYCNRSCDKKFPSGVDSVLWSLGRSQCMSVPVVCMWEGINMSQFKLFESIP